MKTGTLWLEITIAGSVYLLTFFFLCLLLLGQRDLAFLSAVGLYWPAVSLLALAGSYVAGLLAHRLRQVLKRWILFSLQRFGFSSTRKKGRMTFRENVLLFQHGSERLQRELDFQFSLLAFFRSLAGGVPLLTVLVTAWLRQGAGYGRASLVLGAGGLVTVACAIAAVQQRHLYHGLRRAALKELEAIAATNTPEGAAT